MSNATIIRNEQSAPPRWSYTQAQISAAEAEYRAAVNALSAEYKAAQAAGDTQRAAEIKAQGVALVNARYGL